MITNAMTNFVQSLDYMRALFTDSAEHARLFFDPCNPSQPIEACIDTICEGQGKVPQTLTDSTVETLKQQIKGLMHSKNMRKIFGDPGTIMRAFLEGQRDGLCQEDNVTQVAEATQLKAAAADRWSETADGAEPAKFEINVSVEDAAHAGAITAGAALIYKALMFGATICPAARPATQGIMMLFGMTPTGFEYESPSDRMSREGA